MILIRQHYQAAEAYYISALGFEKSQERAELAHQLYEETKKTQGPPKEPDPRLLAGKATIVRQRILGGVSGFHQYNENLGIQQNRWAGFASTTWQKVTLLGEYGGGTQRAFGAKTNLWAAFAELDYRLMRGINLRGKFDYLDPDKDISGDQYKRWLVETDLMPVPFTEVKLSYRNHDEPPAPKFEEYLVQFFFPF